MAEYKIDCTKKILGRVASEIALILQGKKNPSYDPRLEGEDTVVLSNVDKLEVSGKKADQKVYYAHSTRIGNLKERTFANVVASRGKGEVLRMAVKRMLPKNRLQTPRMKRLTIEGEK